MLIFWLVCILSIFIDQISKYFIELNLYNKSIEVIKNVFSLTYLQNKGAAWGFFANNNWVLLILIPVILLGIIIYLYKNPNTILDKISVGMVVGGAVGNYIDRIFRGYVVDFLDFKIWPVFNVADIFIVIGCIVFFINLLIKERKIKYGSGFF